MKNKQSQNAIAMKIVVAAAIILVLAVFGRSVQAAGMLKPKKGSQSAISIKSHEVTVVINNGYARTEVDQVFINSGNHDLEAIYSFPLPKQASLSELSLWIDGNEIIGEVLEKKAARKVYEAQRDQGRSTAVAEKDDYQAFTVSVSPVIAGNETRVRLVYYQPLAIDLNVGRYVYPLAEGGVDEQKIAFWSVDSEVKEHFTFDLTLKSAVPIKDLRMPGYEHQAILTSEPAAAEQQGSNTYHARLDFTEGARLNNDVIFYYRLDESVPARVELVPFKAPGSTGTFMLTITPGADLQPISEGVDWTFVLDKSGSMSGGKIQTLLDGVSRVIGKLSANDRFRVITFNDSTEDVTHGYLNATPEHVQQVLATLNRIVAGGGTDLHSGLARGLKSIDDERTSTIILVTDGVANVGQTQRASFMQLLEHHDVRLFTFIMGNSANRPLLEKLARASGGFAMDVSDQDDIYGRILLAKNKVLYQALHNARVQVTGTGIKHLTPPELGSLYRGQQAVVFGQYEQATSATISFSAKISGEDHEWNIRTTLPDSAEDNPELERLWALSRIEEHMEGIRDGKEPASLKKKVISLGEEYSLVTDYTSMIVVEDEALENLGLQKRNHHRVQKERAAQQRKAAAAPTNNRVADSQPDSSFKNAPSPSFGSGPVGPLFLLLLAGCRLFGSRRSVNNQGS